MITSALLVSLFPKTSGQPGKIFKVWSFYADEAGERIINIRVGKGGKTEYWPITAVAKRII